MLTKIRNTLFLKEFPLIGFFDHSEDVLHIPDMGRSSNA
jgi:hypothetical protein